MPLWLILAGISTLMIAASSFCVKWSQRLGTPVIHYVAGRILCQTALMAVVWLLVTRTRLNAALRRTDWGPLFLPADTSGADASSVPVRWWSSLTSLLGWPQLITAVLFLLLSMMATASIQLAPNPGYTSSILSTSALLIALLSPLVYPDVSLSWSTFLGACLVAVGVSLITITSSPPSPSPAPVPPMASFEK